MSSKETELLMKKAEIEIDHELIRRKLRSKLLYTKLPAITS